MNQNQRDRNRRGEKENKADQTLTDSESYGDQGYDQDDMDLDPLRSDLSGRSSLDPDLLAPDAMDQESRKEFMMERIKERPINKKRLMRRTLLTAALAVMFGLVACITIILLEPVINNFLYPEEEKEEILFPEDSDEMSPEEMLADTMYANQPEESAEAEEAEEEPVVLEDEQIQEILDSVELDLDNYQELYISLYSYISSLSQYMVTFTCTSSSTDWMNNLEENEDQTCGLIIAKTSEEVYILSDYETLSGAERLVVAFYSGMQATANIKQYDPETGLAIVVVDISSLTDEQKESISVATLGSSKIRNVTGLPVVAVGSPQGVQGSIGYGMISSPGMTIYAVDANYSIFYTNIYGSNDAKGFLFNLEGEVVGVITSEYVSEDMENLITVFGISDLKNIISKMVNTQADSLPCLGITGTDVSNEAHEEMGLPLGAYVSEIEMDSPAMTAGIQQGDIIVRIDDTTITNFTGYTTALLGKEEGQVITVVVMRLSVDEYKEISFSVTVGGTGKPE